MLRLRFSSLSLSKFLNAGKGSGRKLLHGKKSKARMPSFLSSAFTMVGLTNYNFEYIILAAERQGATELSWSGFYTSVPNWDVNKLRPDDWLYIKMTESKRIVYRPIQPFDLSLDPVSRFVTFTDYEPADKRSKYKSLRTLKEIQPGAWPTAPSPDETLIATQLDVAAIAKAAEEADTGRRLLTRTTAPSPKTGDGNGTSDPDAKSVDPVTDTSTTTAVVTAPAVIPEAATFSKSEMEAAIKKQLEELIKKPDEVTIAAEEKSSKKKLTGKQPKKEKVLLAKPMSEEALALMRQEIRSEMQKEFEAKEETKRRQQQQFQFQQQQQQQQQAKQQHRDANYGYRMRTYRRSRSKSRSQTPPGKRSFHHNNKQKIGKRSYSNERASYRSRSRSRSRSRETKKESGSLSEPAAEVVESKAVELVRLGLEQLTQRVSSSGEDAKKQSQKEMSLQQRERQLQLQQQQLEQQQQMLSLQQQQQLQKQQYLIQQQKTRRPAHSTFHLPGPEPAVFLPYPRSKSIGQLSSRPPLPKRQTLEEGLDGQWRESSSPDVTPERFHKASGGGQLGFQNQHQLWLQFQRQQQQQEADSEISGISRLKRS